MASANGFGLRDRSDSSEWVSASTPVAAVGVGRQADRQLRIEDATRPAGRSGGRRSAFRPAASSVITP